MHKKKKISHYVLKEQLGKGNFGAVYKGVDTIKSKPVAVKVINNATLLSSRQAQALDREIQIMLNLHHDNIVKLYDHLETQNNHYLILEFCQNGDLSQFKSGIGEEQTVFYLRQIIKALKVLHEYNIIHRDLKPANVFLAKDNQIKLGDFGLSRTVALDNLAQTYVGSPFYMSPEVLMTRNNGSERYDFKADIWSLGCIVYELISGRRPFDSKDLDDMILNFRISSYDFLSGQSLSPVCIDFLKRIFRVNAEERIGFDEMCEHEFVLGRPSIKTIVDMGGIMCLDEELVLLTAEDAAELANAISKTAEYSSHPFLMYMKACIALKPWTGSKKCSEMFRRMFEKAQVAFGKTDWENSTVSKVILETVLAVCRNEERENLAIQRENYKNAYVLLKGLRPSALTTALKEALKKEMNI
jgi:serine/threonine protein kinase